MNGSVDGWTDGWIGNAIHSNAMVDQVRLRLYCFFILSGLLQVKYYSQITSGSSDNHPKGGKYSGSFNGRLEAWKYKRTLLY